MIDDYIMLQYCVMAAQHVKNVSHIDVGETACRKRAEFNLGLSSTMCGTSFPSRYIISIIMRLLNLHLSAPSETRKKDSARCIFWQGTHRLDMCSRDLNVSDGRYFLRARRKSLNWRFSRGFINFYVALKAVCVHRIRFLGMPCWHKHDHHA